MITHLLDTDMLTLYQRGHPVVSNRCTTAPLGTVAITVLSVEEQFLGWYTQVRQAKSDNDMARAYDRMVAFATFIRHLSIASFSLMSIQRYRSLKSKKIRIGNKDLCIAAIALELGAVLVTANASDFSLVPGLTLEDWRK